jgi:hypothetical protein
MLKCFRFSLQLFCLLQLYAEAAYNVYTGYPRKSTHTWPVR